MDIINFFNDLLLQLSSWMKGYLNEIVLAMVATLLVIYGDKIMLMLRQQIGSLKLFLRFTLFVLFCAFGFSFLTSIATPFIAGWLALANPVLLPVLVVVIFYFIGYLAQKKGML